MPHVDWRRAFFTTLLDGHALPEAERLSAAQLLDVVDNAISQLGHKPAIVIDESLSHFTGRADDAGGASGLVSDGRIHLFRDAIAGTAEAVKTVWHELLHNVFLS